MFVNHVSWMGVLRILMWFFFLILVVKIATGKRVGLALIAISALHGPFRQVRVGEIAALSILPEKSDPQ